VVGLLWGNGLLRFKTSDDSSQETVIGLIESELGTLLCEYSQ